MASITAPGCEFGCTTQCPRIGFDRVTPVVQLACSRPGALPPTGLHRHPQRLLLLQPVPPPRIYKWVTDSIGAIKKSPDKSLPDIPSLFQEKDLSELVQILGLELSTLPETLSRLQHALEEWSQDMAAIHQQLGDPTVGSQLLVRISWSLSAGYLELSPEYREKLRLYGDRILRYAKEEDEKRILEALLLIQQSHRDIESEIKGKSAVTERMLVYGWQ